MARIRSVHPGLFSDEAFVSCSLAARLLTIGLWTEADDKGVFEWKPVTLKMRIFPADSIDVVPLLDELSNADIIHKYEHDGRQFGAVRNFRKYQRPKTPNDIHPLPPALQAYVRLLPISETKSRKRKSFPQKGEIAPQMEDGGWKREDEGHNGHNREEGPVRGSGTEESFIDPDGVVHDPLEWEPEFEQ